MIYLIPLAGGLVIVAITIFTTARQYGSLPDQIAIQYWPDGSPVSMLPRPAIWTVVALQVLVLLLCLWIGSQLSGRGGIDRAATGAFIAVDCGLAVAWRVQVLILDAAKNADNYAQFGLRFLMFVGVAVAIALLSAAVGGRAHL
jgi:hypothetical protein